MATIVIYTCSKIRASRVNDSNITIFYWILVYKLDFTCGFYNCKNCKCNFVIELTPAFEQPGPVLVLMPLYGENQPQKNW